MSSYSYSDASDEEYKIIANKCFENFKENTKDITSPEAHAIISKMNIEHCLIWKVHPCIFKRINDENNFLYQKLFEKSEEQKDAGS